MSTMTLKDFYKLNNELVSPRKRILKSILNQEKLQDSDLDYISEKHKILDNLTTDNFKASFILKNDLNFTTDVSYELIELKKDLLFLNSENYDDYSFLKVFNDASFNKQVQTLIDFLSPAENLLCITDRDGTINNYCARYLTSIQSIYNGYYLSRFSKSNKLIILTSAPLIDKGMADISLLEPFQATMAGSKGREYLSADGNLKTFAIPQEKQMLLDIFNDSLNHLLKKEKFEILNYIGSGLQHKFGQTTIARQDISGIIPPETSEKFLKEVKDLCLITDPAGKNLFIEDTGLDIEIILAKDDSDFNKGDGVDFLCNELNISLPDSDVVICGDTSSDIPMLTKVFEYNKQCRAVFVTQDEKLKKKIQDITGNCFFVNSPDILVSAMGSRSI